MARECFLEGGTRVWDKETVDRALKAWRQSDREPHIGRTLLIMAVFLVPVVVLVCGRSYFNYATETDLLNTYAPEARRILAGLPLTIEYHPPVYSLVLAAVLFVIPDLFTAGLVISCLSSSLALGINFKTYQILFGRRSGWASVAALWASTPLLVLSVSATSDAFFFLLFSLVLGLTVSVIQQPNRARSCLVLGLVIGIAFLTRSNGVTLFASAAAPFVTAASLTRTDLAPRVRSCAFILMGSLFPISVWYFISAAYGMPFSPGGTVDNLAMTYFSSGDGIGFESMAEVQGRFDSVAAVLLHDPAALASKYSRDLFLLPDKVSKSIAYPLSLIALVGAYAMFKRGGRAFFAVIILIFLPQILLVNLKTFEHRFYVFLAPLIAVAIWEGLRWGYEFVRKDGLKKVYLAFALGAFMFVGITTMSNAHTYIHAQDDEIGTLSDFAKERAFSSAIVVSRKPQTAYYLGADHHLLIGGHDLNGLSDVLQALHAERGGQILVYYGSMERWKWSALSVVADADDRPSWLSTVACFDHPQAGWCLYQYVP